MFFFVIWKFLGRNARALTSQKCNRTCLNGGQCYIDELNGGQAKCSCPNEYFGSRCEYSNVILSFLLKSKNWFLIS